MSDPRTLVTRLRVLEERRQSDTRRAADLWDEFGRSVRVHRARRQWSLTTLSTAMGIEKSLLSYLETGQRTWSLPLAMKAVEALT